MEAIFRMEMNRYLSIIWEKCEGEISQLEVFLEMPHCKCLYVMRNVFKKIMSYSFHFENNQSLIQSIIDNHNHEVNSICCWKSAT